MPFCILEILPIQNDMIGVVKCNGRGELVVLVGVAPSESAQNACGGHEYAIEYEGLIRIRCLVSKRKMASQRARYL